VFKSPLPNQQLWTGPTVGFLQTQECFTNGGWWHDEHILEATGEGLEKEEPRAWEGWWNENIAKLVRMSAEEPGTLTVLLTGRAQKNFANIVTRMVQAKGLNFDMVCLKPEYGPTNQTFSSTMQYKQGLLEALVYTFKDATELKIYEDRVKHVQGFKDFFAKLNNALTNHPSHTTPRRPFTADVIQVAEQGTTLDPVTETAEIQRMINGHNIAAYENPMLYNRMHISRQVFFTGWLLKSADTQRLLSLIDPLPNSGANDSSEIKYLANNILICPRPAPRSMLDRVGGIGARQTWQATALGAFDRNKVYALRVQPINPADKPFTENMPPLIVLACRKGAKTSDAARIKEWKDLPSDKQFVFETTVGEKVQLRIVNDSDDGREFGIRDGAHQGQANGKFGHQGHSRKRAFQDDRDERRDGNEENGPPGRGGGYKSRGNDRGGRGSGRGGDGRGKGDRRDRPPRDQRHVGGGGGGGGGGGRGRGRGAYKSLDDMGDTSRYARGKQFDGASYDDGTYDANYPPIGAGGNDGGGLSY